MFAEMRLFWVQIFANLAALVMISMILDSFAKFAWMCVRIFCPSVLRSECKNAGCCDDAPEGRIAWAALTSCAAQGFFYRC
ncbi:hypothetical protein D1012_01745 [Pseudotabrizicola alkalilacus]|uniref:Uncharacterized protein n=1 Tax=Pseudotabrizicola alkalilacus TaxID=2305252 RepID=A0A411Z766_9RHOB|nr:hypothetical protein D1012_01745 [Pseudotabrizicola alkalilacus]